MTSNAYNAWTQYFGHELDAGFGDSGNHYAHYQPFPAFHEGDDLFSATDIDVIAETDLDIENNVDIGQNTVVDVELGFGSSAIFDESANAAPQQSAAIGNFDGDVQTGGSVVEAGLQSGPAPFGFGFGGNNVTAFADIDVVNVTDIDIENNVTAIQNTVIDIDVGPGASAIFSDALNVAPQQNIAVGNFGGFAETGGAEVLVDDFVA